MAKSQTSQTRSRKPDAARGQEILICIPAEAEYVRVVRLAVTGVASRMPFSFDEVEEIKLAVTEACNNAILHARPPDEKYFEADAKEPSIVTVQLWPRDDALEIWVSDEGRVPPPGLPDTAHKARRRAEAPLEELPESGLGLLLIETLMDEVEHFTSPTQHTRVRMVKFCRAARDGVRAGNE